MNCFPINVYSDALNSRKTVYVSLPASYEEDGTERYPVIYLLHGRGGNETDWIYKGRIKETLAQLSQSSQLRDAILVMPGDGGYDRGTFYADWYDGSGNFEQYMIHDVIPEIDRSFRTIPSRSGRVIGGFSMGGYGAFMLALNHPELFGAAGSISGALLPLDQYPKEDRARIVGPPNGPHAQRYDLYRLAKQSESFSLRPELYFTCGSEDDLLEGNRYMNSFLDQLQYRHFYSEQPGEHSWEFAKEHVSEILLFFERYFAVQQPVKS